MQSPTTPSVSASKPCHTYSDSEPNCDVAPAVPPCNVVPPVPLQQVVEVNPPPTNAANPSTNAAPPLPSHPMVTRSKVGVFKPRYPVDLTSTALLTALATASEPRSFKSALKSPQWLAAMKEVMDALHSNQTWDLVPKPPGVNIVGSKWVFRTKYHSNGSIDR